MIEDVDNEVQCEDIGGEWAFDDPHEGCCGADRIDGCYWGGC